MNQLQFIGIIRILLASGSPLVILLIAHGFTADQISDASNWIIAGVPIVLGLWSWAANRPEKLAQATGDIPGVKVVVTEAAPEAVQAVAKDTSITNVNMAPTDPGHKPPGRGSSPR